MTARAFDGALIRLAPGKHFTIDFWATAVRERAILVDVANPTNRAVNEGQQFYGIYARWRPTAPFGLDLYALGLVDDPTTLASGARAERGFVTLGGRFFASTKRLWWVTEGAYQIGSDIAGDLRAYALASRLIYSLPVYGTPYFGFEYSRASGDGNPLDGRVTTFNQLFPTGHIHLGYIDYVGWRNVQGYRATVGWKPLRTNLWIDVHRLEMLEAQGAWYAAGGQPFIAADPRRTHVVMGTEIDFTWTIPVMKQLAFSLGYSLFVPGAAAERAPGSTIGRGSDVSHWAFASARSQF
jgi:hypothetical protein